MITVHVYERVLGILYGALRIARCFNVNVVNISELSKFLSWFSKRWGVFQCVLFLFQSVFSMAMCFNVRSFNLSMTFKPKKCFQAFYQCQRLLCLLLMLGNRH